jgi:hypothetical protein
MYSVEIIDRFLTADALKAQDAWALDSMQSF